MWCGWICLFLWPVILKRTLSGNGYLKSRKRFFYHNGSRFVESNEVRNITFKTSFTVDFGSQYYLSTFEFKSTSMDGPVSVALHRESVQDEAIECTDNSVQENVYNFTCANVSHFLRVISNTTMTMVDIVIKGYAVYSELFIGCYEITQEEEMKNESELLECISLCNTEKFAFAGVKDGHCLCKNSFIDMNLLKIEDCENSTCRDGVMCGSGDIVPMYFSAIDKLLSYPRVHPNCIQNKSVCMKCPYGYSGPKCNNRNCSIDNGLCGNGICNRYNSKVKVSVCLCKSGFNPRLSGYCEDVDECRNPTICGVHSECINAHGTYECLCPTGFKLNKTSKKCNDVDECQRASACNTTSTKCFNTIGSYHCECLKGFDGSNLSKNSCRDIDECRDGGKHLCLVDEVCTNTYGSFFCACFRGYSKDTLLQKCIDINECRLKTDACDRQSTKCRNTEGSYECSCIPGFKKNTSVSCFDFDECSVTDLCSRNTKCRNLIGSYDCPCLTGYEEKSAYECTDINECLVGGSKCDKTAICKNTLGSYLCHCDQGTRLEIYEYLATCVDIDECSDVEMCIDRLQFVCINYHKGFACECRSGLTKVNKSYCKARSNDTEDYRGESEYRTYHEDSHFPTIYILYGFLAVLGLILVLSLVGMTCKSIRSAELRRVSSHSTDEEF